MKFRKSKKCCWCLAAFCEAQRNRAERGSPVADLSDHKFTTCGQTIFMKLGALVDFLKKHSEHSGSQFGFNSTLPSKLLSSPVRSVSFRQNHCSLLSLTARKTEDFSKRFAKIIDHFSVRRLYIGDAQDCNCECGEATCIGGECSYTDDTSTCNNQCGTPSCMEGLCGYANDKKWNRYVL